MGATLFKEVSYTLSKLLDDIKMGEIGLPDIQRPFVWPNKNVRDLFDSMYKGFPVGYLLFWANGASDNQRQIGTDKKQKTPDLLIIDGQQRLTSLYAVINGTPIVRENYEKEGIQIAFNPISQKFEVADVAIKRDPEFIPDISVIWSDKTDIFDLADEYLTKLRQTRDVNQDEQKQIRKAINNLDNVQNYPFTALEVSASATEEDVAEIFVRVNSKGKTLIQTDFILTLMSVFWDKGRTEIELFCRNSHLPASAGTSPYNHYIQPDPNQLLRISIGYGFRRARLQHVYNILRGKDLDTGEFSSERRDAQFGILQSAQSRVLDVQNWHEFLKTLRRAGYTGQSMITSVTSLLYSYVFYLIGKYDFKVEPFVLREAIARWFFTTTLTGRYSGSFESTMEQDLNRLRDIKTADAFVALLNKIVNDTMTDDYWRITLPNELATSSPRSPSLFAYYAALNLLQAKVLFSKMQVVDLLDPAIKSKKSAIERHHLFPKGYLGTLNISDNRDTNQIANFALVEWNDNIAISDEAPPSYYPKYASRFSNKDLQQMSYWHGLPEGWADMEYQEFLEARRKLIADVIKDGFMKLSDASVG